MTNKATKYGLMTFAGLLLVAMVIAGVASATALPSEYQEIEYIQSTGTQYIDTGVPKPTSSLTVEAEITLENTNINTKQVLTTWVGTTSACVDYACLLIYNGRWAVGDGGGNAGGTVAATLSAQKVKGIFGLASTGKPSAYAYVYNGNSWIKSSGSVRSNSLPGGSTVLNTFVLFYDGTCTGPYYGKIYSAKYYENGNLTRNFIPAIRISDSVIGMYDTVNSKFYTNKGTGSFTAGPYVIRTVEDLKKIVNGGSLSGTYLLMNDIDCGGQTLTPIGDASAPFTGAFYGQNSTISNFEIHENSDYIGLFGYVSSATIQDVNVYNYNVSSGGRCVGGLVGYAYSASSIVNCHVMHGSVSGGNSVGGLVGYASSGTLTECSADSCYASGSDSVSGLVGYSYAALTNCSVDGCYVSGRWSKSCSSSVWKITEKSDITPSGNADKFPYIG